VATLSGLQRGPLLRLRALAPLALKQAVVNTA
jgi:hypothetical protein